MAFFRQTWTLCKKTLTIVFLRHWLGTLIRAFLAPIIFIFIISYAKNFFVPPSEFGIGSPIPLRSLTDVISSTGNQRDTVAFVHNGYTGGDISRVISRVSQPIENGGKTVRILEDEVQLLRECPSSVRGVSHCFGAVVFDSSPSEGQAPVWNYTIRADGAFGTRAFVNSRTNDAQVYTLPLQHAVDEAIASLNGSSLPSDVLQYPYTDETAAERDRSINEAYMGALIDILAVAYFVGIVGICYQLTGEMAKERELGMSQLIESMMPNKQRWQPQVARLISTHLAFDILYLPSWIIMGAIVQTLNYKKSSLGVVIPYFILSGLALSSYSIAGASLFRKAQLSGITVVIVSVILAIIVQVVPPTTTAATTVLSLLFPPMQYTLFIIYLAYWQQEGLPADLAKGPPTSPWQTPGYLFFIFAIIQIVAFPILGGLVERSLYGTASKARTLRYENEQMSETVKISNLSKHYQPSWFQRNIVSRFTKSPKQTVYAVNDLNLSVLRGQISVLLGANGSGKSTTLDMMAGLQVPSGGTIDMDATGGIGLCPQKNVLWDELTVLEHVQIFNSLKAKTVDSKSVMKDLVKSCDLEQKINAASRTLSGGQKRKCQLAMMLTGGSSLCMLDEVSSGLDPLSRAKIWDILLAERGNRSMLLTTHFMDEGDLLSDDITILSQGNVVASGSAVALKNELGGGYRVRIYNEDLKPLSDELEAVRKETYHDQVVYRLENSTAAASFVRGLEKAGVTNYICAGPTLEDVFLKLAEEIKEELEKDKTSTSSGDVESKENGLQLVTGRTLSLPGQTMILFRKRLTILKRNTWPYAAALLVPIVAAGLVTLFLSGFQALSCSTESQFDTSQRRGLDFVLARDVNIPLGPPSDTQPNLLSELYPLLQDPFNTVGSRSDFNDYIDANFSSAEPGGFYLGDSPLFAWLAIPDMSYAIATQNLMDVSLSQIPIITAYQPFDSAFLPSAGDSLQFILYFGLAMCVYPAFFALYVNRERLHNVRALHYSNGVRAGPLWTAYTLFDMVIVLLVSAIAVIIFTGASDIWYGPGYLFVVFALYGLAATLTGYVVSLFTTSQLATFAFTAGGQCSLFLIYFIAFMAITTYAPAAQVDMGVNAATLTIGLIFPSANLLRSLLLTFNQFSVLCRGDELASYPGDILVYGGPILYLILQSIVLLGVLVWYDSGWRPGFLTRKKHRVQDAEEMDDVDPEVFTEAKRADECSDELRVLHATKAYGPNVAVQDVTFAVPKGEVFSLLGPNGAGKSTTIGLIRGDSKPSDGRSDILVENISILRHRAEARSHLGVCPQFDAMDDMTAIEHLRFYARARGLSKDEVERNVDEVIHAVGLSQFKTRMAAKLSGGNKRKLSLGIALIGNPTVLLLDEPSSGMDAASKRVMWRTLTSVSAGRSLILTTHSMEEADAICDRAGIMARQMLAVGTADQLRKRHGDAQHVHIVHKDAPHTSDADMREMKDFVRRTFSGAEIEERSFHGQMRFSVPNDRTAVMDDSEKTADISSTGDSNDHNKQGISALFAQLEANKDKLGFEYYSVSQATLDQVFLSIIGKHQVMEENYAREHPRKEKMGTKIKKAFDVHNW